ncbi:MAG: hypothetical protein WC813_03355 [Patescibacteria group bacterium]|jgi:hypothetical protein
MAAFTIPSVLIETTRQLNQLLGINLGVPLSGMLPKECSEDIGVAIELYFPNCSDDSFRRVKIEAGIHTGVSDDVRKTGLSRWVALEHVSFRGWLLPGRKLGRDLLQRLERIEVEVTGKDSPQLGCSFALNLHQMDLLKWVDVA